MPRYPRKSFETLFFHVIVQGINKEYIFYNEEYIKKYQKLLLDNANKYDITLISYCIMNNHAHILLTVNNIEDMSLYMKCINTSYAKYYNKCENRVGFVFRNRFESEPIYEENYLLNCMAYIHNNPVKAGIVNSPKDYSFSSYNDYLQLKGIANKDTIRLVFGSVQNFLDTYKLIHLSNNEFKDYIEDIDYKKVYNYLGTLDLKDILSDNVRLKHLLKELTTQYKVPINKICELLHINRFKIYRILKN